MREMQRQPGEDHPARDIAERDRDLVPQPPVGEPDARAEQHSGRNHEHVHDRVLEALGEERHDRKPHRGDLPGRGLRRERHDDAEGDHPVAEDRPADRHGHTLAPEPLVAEGLGLGGGEDLPRHLGAVRERRCERGKQERVKHAAEQVTEEDPRPVGQERAGVRPPLEDGEGDEREVPCDQLETEQDDHHEPDGKDERADEADARLQRRGEGQGRRESEEGAGQEAARQEVPHGQPALQRASLNHLRHHRVRFHIGHRSVLLVFQAGCRVGSGAVSTAKPPACGTSANVLARRAGSVEQAPVLTLKR